MTGVLLPALMTGAVLGLSVAAPFGPIALLCVQRSLTMGAALGIVTGLGAASVHVFYATVAITGASVVSAQLVAWGQPVRLLSCILLVALGIRALRRRPPSGGPAGALRPRAAFASSFVLALCNPLTILPYLLFASSAAATAGAATALTPWSALGVFMGATAWYSVISGGAALFRSGLPPGAVRMLNQAAGAMLIGFGLLAVLR